MTTRRKNPVRTAQPLPAALAAFLLLAAVLCAAAGAAAGAGPAVRVVADPGGQRLQVDGRDFMVLGMNWDYMPIGDNYMYSLWAQPDDVVTEALAREMPLLQDMGVNAIRQYAGIPPRWVRHIYETYGITTVINPLVARYGYTLDGVWIPAVDYSDPRLRAAVKAETAALVREFQGTPGVLMWLLGNENNYGLSWSSFEIEALPEGERDAARARFLYSLYGEITAEIKQLDPDRPVAIANGDLQYIDIIAQECGNLDVFGTNVYRGISARDLFQVVQDKLGIPVMFTEFGADAFNARQMREDQATQTRYLVGQWQEIYEQSHGKGGVGNAVGGFIFQWSDGWWKYQQDANLEVHDTNASWPNGGYAEDFVPGENNMNEEWWGITAKGRPDHRGLYDVYPRAAYYALRRAFALDPYAPGTDAAAIRAHFGAIRPAAAALEARGDRAALAAEAGDRVRLAGLRLELETYSTGAERTTTPETRTTGAGYPSFQGFDQMQSFYAEFEAKPTDAVTGRLSLNVLGDVPENPIDEIFYENRGRPRTIVADGSNYEYEAIERVKVYQSSIAWDDRWFRLDGFYRTGHLHWGHEGDFFGLYRNAFYGENIDIYNGMAPVGFEIAGKRSLQGLKVAFGPQLWWGANPAVLVKVRRQVGPFDATAIYHEDIAPQSSVTSSIAIPLPETRKATVQVAARRGPFGLEVGGIWSGSTKKGQEFQVVGQTAAGTRILRDRVSAGDAFGAKAKLTYEKGRLHWYTQAAFMGLVADAGPTETVTYTGWFLEDSGSGNQSNLLTGLAYNAGDFQIGPNFLWQKPRVGPVPGGLAAPARPRNVLDDPFAVRGNRETFGAELLVSYDPTPASWLWAWDNDVREDAALAASLGLIYRDQPTTADASVFIAEDGRTTYAFPGATPPRSLWEVRSRIVSRLGADSRLVANIYAGTSEPNGYDPSGANAALNRVIHRYGIDARLTRGPLALAAFLKLDDWGPYDYHRDFNLTYPLQLMADVSYSLGQPRWFGFPQTRLGVRGTHRTLDEFSPRYEADGTGKDGKEWEVRTYLHLAM